MWTIVYVQDLEQMAVLKSCPLLSTQRTRTSRWCLLWWRFPKLLIITGDQQLLIRGIPIWISVSSPEEPSAIHAYRAIFKSSATNIPHSINHHFHHHDLRHHRKSIPVTFLVLLCVELVSKKGWSISINHRFIGYVQWSNNRSFSCPPIHTWWLTKKRNGLWRYAFSKKTAAKIDKGYCS